VSGVVVPSSVRVVAAVVRRGEEILLTQRPPGGALGLQWEFPGGKIEAGESVEAALVREIREELAVGARIGDVMQVHRHRYAHGLEVELTFLACTLESHEFTPSAAVHAWRWVRPADVALESLLEADREFVRRLAAAAASG
jgi:8-oxo-dGTP diphosphatase